MPRRGVTLRQVYALAAAFCAKCDEHWPESFEEASELIERLRTEIGHPHPRLEDTPYRPRPRWKRRMDSILHEELVDEFLRT